MALIRWEPLGEIESMRRMMDRMVDQIWPTANRGMGGLPTLDVTRVFAPNVEVFTTDKDVVVTAELPGIDPDEVTVEITEDLVHIAGEMKREEEIREDNYFRTERQYGQFERLLPLPSRVKDQDAVATFKHGVLTIRAPLAEEVKKPQVRKLQIEKQKGNGELPAGEKSMKKEEKG